MLAHLKVLILFTNNYRLFYSAEQLLLDMHPKLDLQLEKKKKPINLLRENFSFFLYITYLGFHD